jgi:hypothetical protein
MHVLPKGFHRIRHYGLLANGGRAGNIARARALLGGPAPAQTPDGADSAAQPAGLAHPCRCCGGRMIVIETFARYATPRHQPSPAPGAIRIDTS